MARLSGATYEDIAKHGNWATSRLITHYLDGVDASVALQMAGFESGRVDSFWLARNAVIPDLELQRKVFPFIEGSCSDPNDRTHYDPYWIQVIDNIMLDRSIYYGRQAQQEVKVELKNKTARKVLSDEAISRRRHLCLLAHLRKVILQDAAIMLLVKNKAAQHPIFKRKVFSTPEFLAFQKLMAETLTGASLRPANLAAVTPVIQQHMEAVNILMSQQTSRQQSMSAKISQISENIEKLQTNQDQRKLHTEQRNQYILEGVVQGMGTMNAKIDALMGSLATSLSDAAHRVATLTPAQVQGGSSTADGPPFPPQLDQLPTELEKYRASKICQPSLVGGELSSSSPLPLVVHSCSLNDDDGSVKSQDKMLAVAAAIAHERRVRGEAAPLMPRHMPLCTLVPRPNTLEGIWQEWFYGVNDNPSIMTMDGWYRTMWRSDKNSANVKVKQGFPGLYLFKKTIVNSVLGFIPDGVPLDMVMVEQALHDFKKMLKDDYNSCSIASYYKLLPKKVSKRFGSSDEKEHGKGKVKTKE